MHICIRIELMISLHMHVNGASCHIIHCTVLSHDISFACILIVYL